MTALCLALAVAQVIAGIVCTIACLRLKADTSLQDFCERWYRADPAAFEDFAARWRDFGAQCHVHGWFQG